MTLRAGLPRKRSIRLSYGGGGRGKCKWKRSLRTSLALTLGYCAWHSFADDMDFFAASTEASIFLRKVNHSL